MGGGYRSWNSFSDANLPSFDDVGLKETIADSWYLWCPANISNSQCKMWVLAITANSAKSMMKASLPCPPLIRPEPRQVKVNDDGSFHANTSAGSAERFFEILMVIFLPHQRFF
jgi:hypothetical protein